MRPRSILKTQYCILYSCLEKDTVIPRLTSDPDNEFSANEYFFRRFWTRLTNMDSANECFIGCAR